MQLSHITATCHHQIATINEERLTILSVGEDIGRKKPSHNTKLCQIQKVSGKVNYKIIPKWNKSAVKRKI